MILAKEKLRKKKKDTQIHKSIGKDDLE